MRQEITFSYSHDDFIQRLGLPKDSVILRVYTQITHPNPRNFCVKISVDEKELDKYLKKKEVTQ